MFFEEWFHKREDRTLGNKELKNGKFFYKKEFYHDARASFIQAKDKGNTEAFNYLAKVCYKFNQLDNELKYLKQGIEAKDGKSYYYLGKMYYLGSGVPKDWEKAEEYYKKAIELGVYGAIESIYVMYKNSNKNLTLLIKWYMKLAKKNRNSIMMYNAWLFFKDYKYNVPKNKKFALESFERAREYGYQFSVEIKLEVAKEFLSSDTTRDIKKAGKILKNLITNEYLLQKDKIEQDAFFHMDAPLEHKVAREADILYERIKHLL